MKPQDDRSLFPITKADVIGWAILIFGVLVFEMGFEAVGTLIHNALK